MRPEAIAAMTPFLAEHAGNPSGTHAASRVAKTALEEARETVAAICGCRPGEVVFTGGGSEADNLAVKGAAWAARARDAALDGVVTSGIEHKAVLGAAGRLEREGFRVAQVAAGPDGTVDVDALAGTLDHRTAVVSVMLVNNETGARQPVDEIARLVRERAPRAVVHTDAVQAPQWLDLAPLTADVALVALSGHKFGGPKGVGALIVRDGTELVPLIEGGGHEQGRRAGTQNVAGIVAFATALRITHERRAEETARIAVLRDDLERALAADVAGFAVNGAGATRVAGLLHCSFEGVEAETLLVALDQHGVMAASGSACSSGAIDPSHVLLAMGMPRTRALSSVRFSLGYASTSADVETALVVVAEVVAKLRARVMARVMVMMSGGVDSSVAAALLHEQGHEVTGVTLKLWGGESDSGCCSVSDVEDARRVAAQIGIPHYVFNFADAFDNDVVEPYVRAYATGETPNPCVECNRTMKFGRVLERARLLDFDFVATGHHARIVATGTGPALARAVDPAKDQSYVLYMLGPDELARVLFPVGELTKAAVRERARALGLRTADEAREHGRLLHHAWRPRGVSRGAHPRRGGDIIDEAGAVVGVHDGVDAFTIGQRRGLGVAVGERRYVTDIAAATGTVTVGTRDALLRDRLVLRAVVRTRELPPELLVQFRAHGSPVPAVLDADTLVFAAPQPRIAPGQVVAFYDGDVCCGGGIVAE